MIELPEAAVLARQIKEILCGRRIIDVIANASPHKFAWFSHDAAEYPGMLTGKTIRDTSYSGNHIEIHIDDMLLAISTPIKYHFAGEKLPQKHQLVLRFEDQSAVSCTVQMWGGILCYPTDNIGDVEYYHIAREKPSPLSPAFSLKHFYTLLDDEWEKLSAKAFLATEQRIPGLGNGVLQDILWSARIHPKSKMGDLSGTKIDEMYWEITETLSEMAEAGGRDTERDLFDRPGGYRTMLSRNTVGTSCPACKAIIRKEAYMGGSIYYCPGCQIPA